MSRPLWATLAALWLLFGQQPAWAHKSSDAYLDVTSAAPAEGQAGALRLTLAVAVKDLDLLVPLDANADGRVTWGEIKAATPAVIALLQNATGLEGPGCSVAWAYGGLERRSDGAYLRFASPAPCAGAARLRYALLRAQDPTHRLIVTGMVGHRELLSTLSPLSSEGLVLRQVAQPGTAEVEADAGPGTLWVYLNMGMHHLLEGYDHLAFLLALVLPLRLALGRAMPAATRPMRSTWLMLLRTVTAFTIGHSITLMLATFGITEASPAWVEPLIAVSIGVTALHNVYPVRHVRADALALLFGLVHGYGFAGLLTEAAAPSGLLLWALAGFNIGVECGQLLAVAGWVLIVQGVVRQPWYGRIVVRGGSGLLAMLSLFWFWQRVV